MSTQSKSRKYAQLLESAGGLFKRYGIRRVSVEEICRHAQVSKMTFYRYFNDKIDIARTMLIGMMEQAFVEYRAIMDSDDSYTDKVTKIIQFKLEKSEDMGTAFFREVFNGPYSELHSVMEEGTAKTMDMAREDFIKAQKQGDIRQDVKPEFLIFLVNQMRTWASDPTLAGLYPSPKEMVVEMTKFFFYGVFDPIKGKK
jgi:AcrR family transcriptional regulator